MSLHPRLTLVALALPLTLAAGAAAETASTASTATASTAAVTATASRVLEARAEQFRVIDTDGNQALSAEEIAGSPSLAKAFHALDADQNGTVSWQEFATADFSALGE